MKKLDSLKALKTIFLASLVAVTCMTVSCSKTGPAGPPGANGVAGASGSAGANGATGATGATGPDSVQYSGWFTLDMKPGYDMSGTSIFIDTIPAPAVTSAILTTGAVLGYLYTPTALAPGDSTIISVDNPYLNYLAELPEVGQIILYSYYDYTGLRYRYVLVPGNVSVDGSSPQPDRYTPVQLRSMNYSTLSAKLHIPATGSSLRAGSR